MEVVSAMDMIRDLKGDAHLNILASSRFAKFVFDVVDFEAVCSVGKAE